jgi:hypothetical protein
VSDLDARCFIRKGNTLVAADFAAEEFLTDIGEGREVLVTVRRARSPKHHRWFFALLRIVVSNSERWGSEEELLEDLKLAVGHVSKRVNIFTGHVFLVTKSINFASMGEDQFTRFRKRCLHVLAGALEVDPVTLMEETDATQRLAASRAPSIAAAPEREPERSSHDDGTSETIDADRARPN